jgi:aminopeptidase
MKGNSIQSMTIALVIAALIHLQGAGIQAQQIQPSELAHKIVATSANVKPGDVVVIDGGKHVIPLMEELAIEVQKAGGLPTVFLESDRIIRSFWVDVQDAYIEQQPMFFAEWIKHIDVWISLPSVEDPKRVWGDIPDARLAKAAKANQYIQAMLNQAPIRLVDIDYPSKESAAIYDLDFPTFEKMHWEAVNADYKQISAKGEKIKAILQGAKKVKVTSAVGTNFSFAIADRVIFVDDGIVTAEEAKANMFFTRVASLPGGLVYCAPIESSANGKLVIPRDRCKYNPLLGVTFDFKNGKLQNFKAEKGGECFLERMSSYQGDVDMFGYFSIGLNPALKVIENGGNYRSANAAGMVRFAVGGNELFGGSNKTQGGFDFPITKATVEVDGKILVKDGQLMIQ